MIALIPVAGYATRLYPLTKETPKALLEVGGKPMLEHVFRKIEELDNIESVVIVSNSPFFEKFSAWAKGFQKKTAIPITVLDDHTTSNENRLGAVGDAQFSIETAGIDSDIVWISGDNLFTFSLKEMQSAFKSKKRDIIGCFDVKSTEEARKMGVLKLDENRKVIDFAEKPLNPLSTLISCGIYFYSRDTVRLFKKYLDAKNNPDRIGDFLEWLYKKKPVFGFVFDKAEDNWFDIGTIEVLEEVQKKFV